MLPAGLGLDVIGVATLFFISWYHAPMAATVDDLAPPRLAVAAQGLVIFTMHILGTAPSSWIVGALVGAIVARDGAVGAHGRPRRRGGVHGGRDPELRGRSGAGPWRASPGASL